MILLKTKEMVIGRVPDQDCTEGEEELPTPCSPRSKDRCEARPYRAAG